MQHTAAANRRLPVSMLKKKGFLLSRTDEDHQTSDLCSMNAEGEAGAATLQPKLQHPADANLFARTGHMTIIGWSHGGVGHQNKRSNDDVAITLKYFFSFIGLLQSNASFYKCYIHFNLTYSENNLWIYDHIQMYEINVSRKQFWRQKWIHVYNPYCISLDKTFAIDNIASGPVFLYAVRSGVRK